MGHETRNHANQFCRSDKAIRSTPRIRALQESTTLAISASPCLSKRATSHLRAEGRKVGFPLQRLNHPRPDRLDQNTPEQHLSWVVDEKRNCYQRQEF